MEKRDKELAAIQLLIREWYRSMTTTLENPMYDLLKESKAYRFARLWKLTRTDSVAFYFTDFSCPLVFGGDTYVPAGGFSSSATEHSEAAEASNLEVVGVLSSSAITYNDLRAGKYEDADLVTWIVDWRYPWAGIYKMERFKVGAIRYDDGMWEADIKGWGSLLLQSKGTIITRTCTADLGDNRCKVLLGPLTVTGSSVTAVIGVYDRLRFTSDLSADFSNNNLVDADGNRVNDGWFNDGKLTWTSGSNNGMTQQIKQFTEPSGAGTDGTVWLWSPTQYDISPGDTFTAIPGCNKLGGKTGHCALKFKAPAADGGGLGNIVNFRGMPFTPGTNRQQQTPAIKA